MRESVIRESSDETEKGSSMSSNISPSAAKTSQKGLASVNVWEPSEWKECAPMTRRGSYHCTHCPKLSRLNLKKLERKPQESQRQDN